MPENRLQRLHDAGQSIWLDFIDRRILRDGPARLNAGGRIFLEIAFDQGPLAKEVAEGMPGWDEIRILKDHAGHDRVLAAKKAS